ncbi:hypothetical protein PCASD_06384 [Puccinia coronata f. sp. avenae]|nr:hypothetical protein PCASD_13476 [Puccinia coronata f. sp. avenae]PLW42359.1 hypothetical protein PCASD_06384 [Puccinia coronata f. sp. avenae]
MKSILTTINLALFVLIQKSSGQQNVTCASYDFSGSSKVCTDSENSAWKCASCTGSFSAEGCLVNNSPQQDPDTVDCTLRFTWNSHDPEKFDCMDEFKHSHTCSGEVPTEEVVSCNDCKRA